MTRVFHNFAPAFLALFASAGRIKYYLKPESSHETLFQDLQMDVSENLPHIIQRLSQDLKLTQKRDEVDEYSEVAKTSALMTSFSKDVQTYLKGFMYDEMKFRQHLDGLRLQFANISLAAKSVSPCKELIDLLKVAKKNLQTLEDTNKSIEKFKELVISIFVWNQNSTFVKVPK